MRYYCVVIFILISSPFLYADDEKCDFDRYFFDCDERHIIPNCDSKETCSGGKELYLADIMHVLKNVYGIPDEKLSVRDWGDRLYIGFAAKIKTNKVQTSYDFYCMSGIGPEKEPFCEGFSVVIDGREVLLGDFLKSDLYRDILKTIPKNRVSSKYSVGYGEDCYTLMCNDKDLDFGSWGRNIRVNDRVTLHDVLMFFKKYFKTPIHYSSRNERVYAYAESFIGVDGGSGERNQRIIFYEYNENIGHRRNPRSRLKSKYDFWLDAWLDKPKITIYVNNKEYDFDDVVKSKELRKDEFIDHLVRLIQGG